MMTLSQAERMIRRIDELIGQPGLEVVAPKLAQDYAELGRAATRRLEQCVAMIENGQDLQALQLAETQPPLLDLLTLLDFRQSQTWRAYCQQHNLPWVEPFYDKHVRLLNATYGKGITSDHAFYRDYRRALMLGDEKRALPILRLIVRLNPGDANWGQELKRLEGKAVLGTLEELGKILASGDTTAALTKLEQMEAAALPIPPNHPVWLQAHLLRCQGLLAQAEALKEQDAWEQTADVVENIRVQANQNNVPLSDADTQRWNNLDAWTVERRTAVMREQDFQQALAALQYQVETSENQLAARAALPVGQMQTDIGLLTGKLQDAERFGRPLDEDLIRRAEAAMAGLAKRIRQRQSRQKMGTLAACVLVLLLLLAGAATYWVFTEQKDATAQLQSLVSARRVGDTEHLLTRIPTLSPPPYRPTATLAAAMAKARDFVAREKQLKQEFEQKAAALAVFAARGFTNDLTQINSQRAESGQAADKLAPEFKSDGQAKLDAFDKLWQDHLEALRPVYNGQFEKLLAEADAFAHESLNLANGFDAALAALPKEQSLLKNLDARLVAPVPLKESLVSQYQNLTNQLALWLPAAAHLRAARDLDDYLNGVQQLAGCSLVEPVQQEAMKRVAGLKHSPAELLGCLLLPDQPQFWDSLATAAAARPTFRPDQPSAEEKDAYFKLTNDKNMQEVYAYYLEKRIRPDSTLESHSIFAEGKLTTNRFGLPTGLVYDPTKYPGDLTLERQAFDNWDYTNVSYLGLTKESYAFHDLGLDNLIDPNTGNYTKSILQLLDQLNRDANPSAMFRAYVSLQLLNLAGPRPAEWGLYWAPGVALHLQNLKNCGAGDLRSGDWLVGKRYPVYERRLKDYFAQARGDSLEKQAEFFQMLAHRACAAGFAFAGFADANGQPVINEANASALECWGWSTRSAAPRLLLRRSESGAAWQKLAPPLPFTPLLVFGEDRRPLLQHVSDITGYPLSNATPFLPPLFSGL